MTTQKLTPDQRYIYEERLGIMCGAATPTPEQHEIAIREALGIPDSAEQMQKRAMSAKLKQSTKL